jgi:hypothetical protein
MCCTKTASSDGSEIGVTALPFSVRSENYTRGLAQALAQARQALDQTETPANRPLLTGKHVFLTYFIGQAFAHIDTEMFRCDYRFQRTFRRE